MGPRTGPWLHGNMTGQLYHFYTHAILESENKQCTMANFQDIMQTVPQLLDSCVAYGVKVKDLRLVCKPASFAALRGIRSYCVKLSTESSASEPLQDVAQLLKLTCLQHLIVEVRVFDTYRGGTCRLGTINYARPDLVSRECDGSL